MIVRKPIVFILFFFISLQLFSQNGKVVIGTLQYQKGEFQKVLESMNIALENPGSLSPEHVVKAYYYRALARLQILKDVQGNEPQLQYLKVFNDLKNAEKYHKGGKFNSSIQESLNSLLPVFNYYANYLLSNANNNESSEKQGLIDYTNSALCSAASIKINKKDYTIYDLNGQANFGKGDFESAISSFQNAWMYYQQNQPNYPDFLIFNSAYRQALIYREYKNEPETALEVTKEALEYLSIEKSRADTLNYKLSKEHVSDASINYQNIYNLLYNYLLDTYLVLPELKDEAILEFENAINNNQSNYMYHIGFAGLLEKDDYNSSKNIYLRAIEINPEEYIGYFNVGVLIYNKASEINEYSKTEPDVSKVEFMNLQVLLMFEEARPFFQKALELNDSDTTSAEVLKVINQALGYDNE